MVVVSDVRKRDSGFRDCISGLRTSARIIRLAFLEPQWTLRSRGSAEVRQLRSAAMAALP
jgi:hypothetical protein